MSDERSGSLEGFVELAKTAKGKACEAIIQQVLRDPNAYWFGELLEMPNVQQLEAPENAEHKPWLDLLRLFAYGTWADYKADADRLPKLTAAQVAKLKYLTVTSLAARHKVLPYELLLRELDLASVRDLEDLLIDCVYLGLIKGKLDQRASVLKVSFAIGRDIGPKDVPDMLNKLDSWLAASTLVMEQLDKRIQLAEESRAHDKAAREELVKQRKDLLDALRTQKHPEHAAPSAMEGRLSGALGVMAGLMGLDDRARPGPRRARAARTFGKQ